MVTTNDHNNMKRAAWVTGACLLTAGAVCLTLSRPKATPSLGKMHLVYSSEGYGGYVGVQKPAVLPSLSVDPLRPARDAYYAGRYAEAESAASRLQRLLGGKSDPVSRKRRVQAQMILAYSAARRGDLMLARDRFSEVREMASALPDHGAQTVRLGETPAPTLEEEGAFQHAVCVGALDGAAGRKAAEAEYVRFMKEYPASILLSAATKRIRHYHHGDLPTADERLFRADMKLQQDQERVRRIEAALCGPECLAELLRRQGRRADVHRLASEMKTDADGTTLLALAQTAQQHGLPARGLELTQAGLAQQHLPAVAYLKTGHFVLVDRVEPTAVTVWDPDAQGPGKAARQQMPQAQWQQAWSGKALGF